MKTIQRSDFESLLSGKHGDYYQGRWEYYKEVVKLVEGINPSNVLEIGPGFAPIVKECDIMVIPEDDYWGRPQKDVSSVLTHDATEKPWPIKDKEYDLVIGLQVWEHLGNKQCRSFREAMRVGKQLILSFPYQWDCPKDNPNYPEHHKIDDELIYDWTLELSQRKLSISIELVRRLAKDLALSIIGNSKGF